MSPRPSISRTVRTLQEAGIKIAQVTIRADGSFDILTQAQPTASDALFKTVEKRLAQGRRKTG